MKLADMASWLTSELQESNCVYLHSVDIVGMGRCAWNSGLYVFVASTLLINPSPQTPVFYFIFFCLFFRQNLAM